MRVGLVGSEMCIRDSITTPKKVHPRERADGSTITRTTETKPKTRGEGGGGVQQTRGNGKSMCVKYLAARRRNWSLIARTSALMDDWWPPGMLPSLAAPTSPHHARPPASNAGRDCTRGPLGNTPKTSHHCFTGVCILFMKSCSGHRVGQHDFVHARTHVRTHACTVITRWLV